MLGVPGGQECFGVILDLLVHLPNITCPPSSTPLHRLGGGQAAHPPTGRLPRPKASLVHVLLPAAAASAAPLLLAPLLRCCRLRCSAVAALAASAHPHPRPCAAPFTPVQPACSQSSPWKRKRKGHRRKKRGLQLGRGESLQGKAGGPSPRRAVAEVGVCISPEFCLRHLFGRPTPGCKACAHVKQS